MNLGWCALFRFGFFVRARRNNFSLFGICAWIHHIVVVSHFCLIVLLLILFCFFYCFSCNIFSWLFMYFSCFSQKWFSARLRCCWCPLKLDGPPPCSGEPETRRVGFWPSSERSACFYRRSFWFASASTGNNIKCWLCDVNHFVLPTSHFVMASWTVVRFRHSFRQIWSHFAAVEVEPLEAARSYHAGHRLGVVRHLQSTSGSVMSALISTVPRGVHSLCVCRCISYTSCTSLVYNLSGSVQI